MSSAESPQDPGNFIIALLGKNRDFLRHIGNAIFRGTSASVTNMSNFLQRENNVFRVVSTPGFFDEECRHPDQLITDLMALCDPGPHRFLLAIKSQNTQEVQDQIIKLQNIFGNHITKYVVIIVENQESYDLLKQMKIMSNIQMATVNENLAVQCKEWCSHSQTFQLDDHHSQDSVKPRENNLKPTRRKFDNASENYLSNTGRCASTESGTCAPMPLRHPRHPPNNPGNTGSSHQSPASSQPFASLSEKVHVSDIGKCVHGVSRDEFNIILLGQTGTGKSASGNTILAAGKPLGNPGQCFESKPSSTPVTTKCEVKMVKISGMKVRVVDTPDFFYEEEPSTEELEKCKTYCQPGKCLVLLVMQLGKFTEGEIGILEKLEESLGWRIRDSTIVLFTHGEDMKAEVEKFIGYQTHLRHIVEACGNRYHLFKNTNKYSRQVMKLLKKFQTVAFFASYSDLH